MKRVYESDLNVGTEEIQVADPENKRKHRVWFEPYVLLTVVEADKHYPEGFISNLPSNLNYLNSRAGVKRQMGQGPFPENFTEFATGLLVEAYYSYSGKLEIQNEIIRRLTLIWKEKDVCFR